MWRISCAAAAVITAACQRGRECVTAVLVFTVIPSPLGQMVGCLCLLEECVCKGNVLEAFGKSVWEVLLEFLSLFVLEMWIFVSVLSVKVGFVFVLQAANGVEPVTFLVLDRWRAASE